MNIKLVTLQMMLKPNIIYIIIKKLIGYYEILLLL